MGKKRDKFKVELVIILRDMTSQVQVSDALSTSPLSIP